MSFRRSIIMILPSWGHDAFAIIIIISPFDAFLLMVISLPLLRFLFDIFDYFAHYALMPLIFLSLSLRDADITFSCLLRLLFDAFDDDTRCFRWYFAIAFFFRFRWYAMPLFFDAASWCRCRLWCCAMPFLFIFIGAIFFIIDAMRCFRYAIDYLSLTLLYYAIIHADIFFFSPCRHWLRDIFIIYFRRFSWLFLSIITAITPFHDYHFFCRLFLSSFIFSLPFSPLSIHWLPPPPFRRRLHYYHFPFMPVDALPSLPRFAYFIRHYFIIHICHFDYFHFFMLICLRCFDMLIIIAAWCWCCHCWCALPRYALLISQLLSLFRCCRHWLSWLLRATPLLCCHVFFAVAAMLPLSFRCFSTLPFTYADIIFIFRYATKPPFSERHFRFFTYAFIFAICHYLPAIFVTIDAIDDISRLLMLRCQMLIERADADTRFDITLKMLLMLSLYTLILICYALPLMLYFIFAYAIIAFLAIFAARPPLPPRRCAIAATMRADADSALYAIIAGAFYCCQPLIIFRYFATFCCWCCAWCFDDAFVIASAYFRQRDADDISIHCQRCHIIIAIFFRCFLPPFTFITPFSPFLPLCRYAAFQYYVYADAQIPCHYCFHYAIIVFMPLRLSDARCFRHAVAAIWLLILDCHTPRLLYITVIITASLYFSLPLWLIYAITLHH